MNGSFWNVNNVDFRIEYFDQTQRKPHGFYFYRIEVTIISIWNVDARIQHLKLMIKLSQNRFLFEPHRHCKTFDKNMNASHYSYWCDAISIQIDAINGCSTAFDVIPPFFSLFNTSSSLSLFDCVRLFRFMWLCDIIIEWINKSVVVYESLLSTRTVCVCSYGSNAKD